MKKVFQVCLLAVELVTVMLRFISLQMRSFAERRGIHCPVEVCTHEMPTFTGEPDETERPKQEDLFRPFQGPSSGPL